MGSNMKSSGILLLLAGWVAIRLQLVYNGNKYTNGGSHDMAMNALDLIQPLRPTLKESGIVKEYLLLPILLTMLQRDIDTIAESTLKVSLPYIGVMRKIMDTVRSDLLRIRKSLGGAGIRIYAEDKNASGVLCKYVCRGFHKTLSLTREEVRAEVSLLAGKYMDVSISSD
jgi:hypothetical protein